MTSGTSRGMQIAPAIASSRSRRNVGAYTAGSVDSRNRRSRATKPPASKVSSAPLRSWLPRRFSSASARWNPSIGTSTASSPRASTISPASRDLPEPGAPVSPRIRRPGEVASCRARATSATKSARSTVGTSEITGSAKLVDTEQVPRGIPERAVANAVWLLGRLLDDLGAAGLQLREGVVEVVGGERDDAVGALGHHLGDRATLVGGDAGVGARRVQDDRSPWLARRASQGLR